MLMAKMHNVKNSLRISPVFLLFFFYYWQAAIQPILSKKKAIIKLIFQKEQYVKFDKPGFPYSFEYPVYASIIRDSSYLDRAPKILIG